MNPPFALPEKEFQFIDHALKQMVAGGLLLAVVPTTVMCGADREYHWRAQLLQRHTLKAVIKLSEDLFFPNARKGTYIVIIQAWQPHPKNEDVFFALMMEDGFSMKKAKRLRDERLPTHMADIQRDLQRFLAFGEKTGAHTHRAGFHPICFEDPTLDCSPEAYLMDDASEEISIASVSLSLAGSLIKRRKDTDIQLGGRNQASFSLDTIFVEITRGDCPPLSQLEPGDHPVVSTAETHNGIAGFYTAPPAACPWKGAITIPANGGAYQAFYHPYPFSALPDVLVCKVKAPFEDPYIQLYLCAALNRSSWRFSYYRKCNVYRLKKDVRLSLPVKTNGDIDFDCMRQQVKKTKGIEIIHRLLLMETA